MLAWIASTGEAARHHHGASCGVMRSGAFGREEPGGDAVGGEEPGGDAVGGEEPGGHAVSDDGTSANNARRLIDAASRAHTLPFGAHDRIRLRVQRWGPLGAWIRRPGSRAGT